MITVIPPEKPQAKVDKASTYIDKKVEPPGQTSKPTYPVNPEPANPGSTDPDRYLPAGLASPERLEQASRQKTTFNLGSIGKITKTTEETPIQNGKETPPDKPVDLEILLKVWDEFTELRKSQVAEYQLLKRNFVLRDNQVFVELNNPIEEPLLHGIRTSLVAYLREKLRNNSLVVTGVLQESKGKKVVYTNKDKFEHLAEKNPVIRDLKERLGLDAEF